MAGIGFELRRLKSKDNFLSTAGAYLHSAMVSSGPWLFTVLALAGIVLLGSKYNSPEEMSIFRLIIIYNFSFSLVVAGPILIVLTRYLSDLIYEQDASEAPGMLIGGMVLLFSVDALFAGPFYFYIAKFPQNIQMGAFINFLLISAIWFTSIFLSALKEYKIITRTYFIGMLVSFLASSFFAISHSINGMIWGFNIGLAVIIIILIALILLEYPYAIKKLFSYIPYFKRYQGLAYSGLFYSLAIWVDKWVMWTAKEGQVLPSGMVSFPIYDSATFLAYLSIIPAMAFFVVSTETDFFEKYVTFFKHIHHHGTLKQIKESHHDIVLSMQENARNFLILQGSVTYICVLLAPQILDYFGIGFLQLGIFRIALLGAFFHVLLLFLTIILSYFDLSKEILWINVFFFVTNGICSYISLKMGFAYYGYGYFYSSMITSIVAYIVAMRLFNDLPYFSFVKGNSAI